MEASVHNVSRAYCQGAALRPLYRPAWPADFVQSSLQLTCWQQALMEASSQSQLAVHAGRCLCRMNMRCNWLANSMVQEMCPKDGPDGFVLVGSPYCIVVAQNPHADASPAPSAGSQALWPRRVNFTAL